MLAAALEAIRAGRQIIPIRPGTKRPTFQGWPNVTWDPTTTVEQFEARLKEWGFEPGEPYNLGVVLGPTSGNLVDVDIDHPKAKRFRDLLPRTQARSGRPGSPESHFWYIAEPGTSGNAALDSIPSTRRYQVEHVPAGAVADVTIEFRYDRGVQTVIPPSDWVPKDWEAFGRDPSLRETRTWWREPWGGDVGPARVNGRKLAVQVALVALATTLLDNWPSSGGRHEAYLALAGALLRQADGVVHSFWERNAGVLIRALASASNDDDGPDAREHESLDSTIKGIRDGKNVWGFPKLAEMIGDAHATQARTLVAEVESLAGYQSRQATSLGPTGASPAIGTPPTTTAPSTPSSPATGAPGAGDAGAPVETEPLETGSWGPIDLDPYLSGLLPTVAPTVLRRDDGHALFYPGRLNMLFAPSESGKTLVALYTALEVMASGERVVYLDFEDEPVNTIERLRAMGAGDDDLRLLFTYIRPDEPIATMQRDHWGGQKTTPVGEANALLFRHTLDQVDPALIIADGMTSIYGLHGLDSNNSVETDVITSWLKSLARNGRTTVIIIDHMSKAGDKGSMPIGSQHKVSMVQGTLLQVWPVRQPVLGSIGELELIVLKDRPGQVRKHAGRISGRAQVAAKVTIDSTGSTASGPTTVFTIAAPANAGNPSAPTPPQGSMQLDLTASAAFKKRERQQAMEALMLSAFGNVVDTALTGKEVVAKIGATWKANGWSATALQTTRDRLIQAGYLVKIGGDRGPNVKYVLQVQIDDGDDDDSPSDGSNPGAP